jgi:hypothetical protein
MSTPQPPQFFFVTNALVLQDLALNLKSTHTLLRTALSML